MASSLPTTRIEKQDDTVKIVFTNFQGLYRELRTTGIFEQLAHRENGLTQEENNILSSLYSTIDYNNNIIRIGTAQVFNKSSPKTSPSPENLAYTTSKITEREPNEEEKEPYQDSTLEPPSEIYEFTLPPLDEFNNPLESSKFLTALQSKDDLKRVSTDMQEEIERAKWLRVKTRIGSENNLPLEWKSSDSQEDHREEAKHKYFTSRSLWQTVFKLNYEEYFSARLFVLDMDEEKVKSQNRVDFELVSESENETYCQYCGRIDDEEVFLKIPDKLDREKRVCELCAEHSFDFDSEVVAEYLDKRAKEFGGQRRLHQNLE